MTYAAVPPPSDSEREPLDPLAVLNSLGEAVYDWDLRTDRLSWSPNAGNILRLDDISAVATGRGFHELTAPVSVTSRHDAIFSSERCDVGHGVPYSVRYALTSENSGRPDIIWVDDSGRWFAGPDGRPAKAHGLVRVAPARGGAEAVPLGRADIDPLTGCLSRARLLEILGAVVARVSGKRAGFGLLMIGVDGLEALNRRYSYDAVDEMLARIGCALRTQTRGTDSLARFAGNRFVLVLDGCDAAQIAPAAARAIELLMSSPAGDDASALRANVRIGGVLAPRHGRNAHALLLNAETALGRATEAERFQLHDPTACEQDKMRRAADTIDDAVAALNDNRVRIALQPIVAARTGECVMSEALLRIELPDGQILEPGGILPEVEDELMCLLDARVFELVAAWLRAGGETTSVNISAATLRDADWPSRVAAILRLNPGIATRLVLEVSEDVATAALADGSRALADISALGVRIAIDHFGAGHASLKALRQLKPDFLKIDGAFMQSLSRSPDDRFLVRALIGVARQIGAPVIAEWIENGETASTLTEWGASYLQGKHFGAAELRTTIVAKTAAVA